MAKPGLCGSKNYYIYISEHWDEDSNPLTDRILKNHCNKITLFWDQVSDY